MASWCPPCLAGPSAVGSSDCVPPAAGLAQALDDASCTGGFKGSVCGQPGAGGRPCVAFRGVTCFTGGCFTRGAEGPLGVQAAAGAGDTGGPWGQAAVSLRLCPMAAANLHGNQWTPADALVRGLSPASGSAFPSLPAAGQGEPFHHMSECLGRGRSREGRVRGARLTLFLPTLACLLHVPQAHLTFPIVGLRPDGAPSAQTLPGSTRPGDASQVPRTWPRLTCPACRERSTSPGMLTSVVPELTQSPRKLSRSPCPHS